VSSGALKRVSYTERRVRRSGGFEVVQVCRFYPFTYSLKPELSAVCPWSELVLLAESLGERGVRGRSLRVGEGVYKRLLVYAAVRQTLRSRAKARELEEVVRGLDEYELHFWYSKFLEAAERGRLALYRPARAFKVLHRLG
jgi:hypothetical protein